MIPHMGTFSALLFQKSPLYEAVTYVILHAFALSLLTVLYLAIQMIVKAKNKYMAFILPPIIMYVLDYLTQTAAQTYSVTMALQPMVARATSFVITIENIAIIFGALLAIDIVCLFMPEVASSICMRCWLCALEPLMMNMVTSGSITFLHC